MNKPFSFLGILLVIVCCWSACKDDVASAGSGVLDADDEITVYVDTFPLRSMTDSCKAIVSRTDSFMLGEVETDYGLLRGAILTQLACPEGYHYPSGEQIKSLDVDSMFLFIYYDSWTGDATSPIAIDAYRMDKKTFNYSTEYMTDLNIKEYCSRQYPILTNRRIVVATEKLDSIQNSNGDYVPMLRLRVNEDFQNYFWSMQSFESQASFNEQFKGILLESSFGSSTMLNISGIALGVYFHFMYEKAGRDTLVRDMKAFYANSEVRTVNQLSYANKKQTIENLQKDSDTYNYIISPACAYTRMIFPMGQIVDTIIHKFAKENNSGDSVWYRRPYVNKAEVRIDVTNVYKGSESQKQRNDWLQPASYMLLIKESSMDRFFAKRELPTDTCALLSPLVQSVDADGEYIYYYTYDLSDFITAPLHASDKIDEVRSKIDKELRMMLVPVSVVSDASGSGISRYSAVRQQATMSATQIESAKNGTEFEIVYSGFTLPQKVE